MAQKNILTIIRTVCNELNLPAPTTVVSSQDQTVLKLLALCNAQCDVLLGEYDWQMLQTRYTFNTVDGQSDYAFPSDIERFISGTFFDTTNRWPLRGPLTPGGWELLKSTNLSTSPFERFRIWNNVVSFYPTPGANTLGMVFEYISNNYVTDGNTGLPKGSFTQDSDICRFDYRLIVFGIKLRWLSSIGQDTTAALVDFMRAYDLAKGTDIPSATLSLMGGTMSIPLLTSNNIADSNWAV